MAITSSDDAKFKAYSEHVFKWEGLMDDDPLDRAVNCVRGLTNVAKRGRKGRNGVGIWPRQGMADRY